MQTGDSIVLVKVWLEQVIDILPGCAKGSQTQTKGTTMANNLWQKTKPARKAAVCLAKEIFKS